MVRTPSTMLPLGEPAPEFTLVDTVSGRHFSLQDFADKRGLVVMFICNHCPFVKHVADALSAFATEYIPRGLGVVAISSNDLEKYPQDGPAAMKQEAELRGYTFPYLLDETQEVAKAYQAACTPDFYLFDAQHRLVYRGQFDDSRPDSGIPVTGRDLRQACDQLLSGQPVAMDQRPSIGCNIKWKPGHEPAYFPPAPMR